MDSAGTPAQPRLRLTARSAVRWAALVALLGYGLLLARHMGAYGGGADSSGYLNHARLLAAGHVHATVRAVPGVAPDAVTTWWYSPLGLKPAADGNGLVPGYPAGLPLLIAGVSSIAGWTLGPHLTMWLHGMAGVLLTYMMAKELGLSRRGALLAAVIVGASPLYLFMTLQLMSDVPALVWVTAAILLACRSAERPNLALAAGAAFAAAVLVRPTNIIAIVPLTIAFGASPARWWRFIAGGLPGGVFSVLHAHAAYGSYFATGYGETQDFGRNWIAPTWIHYGHWLPLLFTPVVLAFLALPFVRLQSPLRRSWLLIAWGGTYLAFYCTYRFTSETWWYLRFVLPAAPAWVIGGLLVTRALIRRAMPRVPGSALLAAGLALTVGLTCSLSRRLYALDSHREDRHYLETDRWLERHVPPNAIIAAMQQSGSLYCYTNFTIVRWDLLDPQSFAKIAAAAEAVHRPIYAVLFDFERAERHALDLMPGGHWTQVGGDDHISVWRWSRTPPPAA